MSKITLRQGDVSAKLSEVRYEPAKGFLADNTWCVAEESICAEANVPLMNGPATVQHGGVKYEVDITVFETEMQPDEEEDEVEATYPIEINYDAGLPKLALALGLLEHLTPKQQRAILGG